MSFRRDIENASSRTLPSANLVHLVNLLIIVVSVVAAPFTMFASLFALLAVPFNAAGAAVANSTYQQKELTKLHLMLLADKYDLE